MCPTTESVYASLRCPACDASPRPDSSDCPGCGRQVRTANGNLDLLKEALRDDADRFAERYQALRRAEGWAGDGGRESPETGSQRLWAHRVKPVTEAAAILSSVRCSGSRRFIVDVGSGGGWAARYLPGADVVALDLVDRPCSATICVRADMSDLPLRSGVADGMLFAASLHYAPLPEVVPEIKRVLRRGGLVIAVDSPIYRSRQARDEAWSRSKKYFADQGFPALIDHYHPIDAVELRRLLADCGLDVKRFEVGARSRVLAALRRGTPPATFVVAEKL